MTNYREILRLDSLGISKVEIAESCNCSRNTVATVLKRASECNLTWENADGMSDSKLSNILYPPNTQKPVYRMPDYAYVEKELKRSGVTLNRLWLEYCEQCRSAGEIPYKSTQFNKYFNDYLVKNSATMHINHKPGEIMQVDWAGDKAGVVNTDTGEIMPAYLFVAVLPYSGYAYVESFFSMNQECWTTAHVNAYKYFGGVAKIIQCDNLKTGVIKHGRDEVELNQSYRDLAEHYNTAIMPCRVRSPKDKAMVEGTVGVVSTFILAALRNRQFLSLSELNNAVWERLYDFNHKPFQKRDGCRASAFEEEKPFLSPLPSTSYELATWKIATVGPNYHISVDGMNYSVPYEYIKQKVDVSTTRNTIEVFFDGNRICSHIRLYGRMNQYSTTEDHMPPNHQKYLQWDSKRFIDWASKIGENTVTVVSAILSSYKIEQQGYKSCMGLLKLADKYTPQRLEAACRKALTYTPLPSFKNVKAILISGQDSVESGLTEKRPDNSSEHGFTRGDSYYKGGKA